MKTEFNSKITKTAILDLSTEYGFQRARVINVQDLFVLLQKAPTPINAHRIKDDLIKYLEETSLIKGAFLVCALSCFKNEPTDLSTEHCSHGLIAPFARRNYYREAVKRMKQLAIRLHQDFDLPQKGIRIFCNSRIAEKLIASAAGLGFYGKNSLIITEGLGSLFVIALLFLPISIESMDCITYIKAPDTLCVSCNACIKACPTKALSSPGIVDINLCLQAFAKQMIILSENIKRQWGFRIYGCQVCQKVCPYNIQLNHETLTTYGEIGPSIALSTILQMQLSELKAYLKGTALGLPWLKPEAIIRNALLAAGNRKDKRLKQIVSSYCLQANPVIQDAASWALLMIKAD